MLGQEDAPGQVLRHLGRYLRKSREKFKAHVAYECAGKVDV